MNIKKVKEHLKENRRVYIGTVAGMVVGTSVGIFVFGNGIQIIDSIKLINWKSSHTSQTILFPRGHRGNIIQCDQTGNKYPSQNVCAKINNINPGRLSNHLNGKTPHVKNLTFTNLGENFNDRAVA